MDSVNLAVRAAVVVLATSAAACGGGGGGDGIDDSPNSPICQVIDGELSSATPPPSAMAQTAQAFDADLDTFATLSPAASATTTVRGSGVSRMAGEIAGVVYTLPTSGSITATITTYRDGTSADSGEPLTQTHTPTGGSQVCPGGYCSNRNGIAYIGLNTTEDFDEVEVSISVSNFSAPLELREICVR